ncbi:MAG: hypothetical protein HY669_03170 [Chloroflexi bacterium]|nr:hypothetical protein [Chloroflexota bacterium]
MGRFGDYKHRETKKPKKDAKKPPALAVAPPSQPVEVVKKHKKKEEIPEE